jgi:hypothetical protein
MSGHTLLRKHLDKDFVELTRLLCLDRAHDFLGCDLHDLDLSRLDLDRFNFSGADLRGCTWDDASVATTVFSEDSLFNWGAITKARDWADNPHLASHPTFKNAKQRLSRLGLCARALGIQWVGQSRAAADDDRDLEKLLKVIENEGGIVKSVKASPIDDATMVRVRMYLYDWREAHRAGNFLAMGDSVRQLQYVVASSTGRHNRVLRLLSILQRLELHRSLNDLDFAASKKDVVAIKAQLDQFLEKQDADELRILSAILARAVPKSVSSVPQIGMVFVGAVTENNGQGDIKVSGLGREFSLAENLISTAWYQERPAPGTLGYFVTRREKGQITQRGQQFVLAVLGVLFPVNSDTTNLTEVFMGASNSWAVVVTSTKKKGGLLANGGALARQLQHICGLRRVTVTARYEDSEIEIKNFVNDGYKDIKDLSIGEEFVWGRIRDAQALHEHVARGESIYDERKVRTFLSMWEKVFPELGIVVSAGNELGFSSKGFREYRKRKQNP